MQNSFEPEEDMLLRQQGEIKADMRLCKNPISRRMLRVAIANSQSRIDIIKNREQDQNHGGDANVCA